MNNDQILNNIQGPDGKEVIDGILTITSQLPVPMIKPITSGVKVLTDLLLDSPDPFKEVNKKLDDIKELIEGLYKKVDRANKVSTVFENTNTISSHSEAIRDLIERADVLEIPVLETYIKETRTAFDQVHSSLDSLTLNYESDFTVDSILLSEYIMNYNNLLKMLLNPASIGLDAYDRSSEFLQKLIDNKKTKKDIKEKCESLINAINDAITQVKKKTDLFIGENDQKDGAFYKNYPKFLKICLGKDGMKMRLRLAKNEGDFMCADKKEIRETDTAYVKSLKKDIKKNPDDYYKQWTLVPNEPSVTDEAADPTKTLWSIMQSDYSSSFFVKAVYFRYFDSSIDISISKERWLAFVGTDPQRLNKSITKIIETHFKYAIQKVSGNNLCFKFITGNGQSYSLEAGVKQKQVDARLSDDSKPDQQWVVTLD